MSISKYIFSFIHDKQNINIDLLLNWKKLVEAHKNYKCELFDIAEARKIIKAKCSKDVLNAYDTLIPYAYKSDLFRYIQIYLKGGIYIDIKYESINNFNFDSFDKEYLVSEPTGIQNCLLISPVGNKMYKLLVERIVENVKNRFYGISPCSPTGPLLISDIYFNTIKNNVHNSLRWVSFNDIHQISMGNNIILKQFPSYRQALQNTINPQVHYSKIWSERNIYNDLPKVGVVLTFRKQRRNKSTMKQK
jgi:hypothetical protein